MPLLADSLIKHVIRNTPLYGPEKSCLKYKQAVNIPCFAIKTYEVDFTPGSRIKSNRLSARDFSKKIFCRFNITPIFATRLNESQSEIPP